MLAKSEMSRSARDNGRCVISRASHARVKQLPSIPFAPVISTGQPLTKGVAFKTAIVLVEYIDYQCPYCAQAVSIVRELQYELGERLCYVVRHFPLVDLHLQAMRAAEATHDGIG